MLDENELVRFGRLDGPDIDRFVRFMGFGGLKTNKLIRFSGPNMNDPAGVVAINGVDINELVRGGGLSRCDVYKTIYRPELECVTNIVE